MYMLDSSTKNTFPSISKYKLEFCQIVFLVRFSSQRVLNYYPTVWLDGARSPSKYVNTHSDNNSGSGVLTHFSLGIHPMYTVSSTKNTFASIENINWRFAHFSGQICQPWGSQLRAYYLARWSWTTPYVCYRPFWQQIRCIALFLLGIHSMYMVDSSTNYVNESIVRDIKHPPQKTLFTLGPY